MAKNTKEMILNSFLQLVEEKDVEKISVTDLVEACEISRQTFYYHFDDISALLVWAFTNEAERVANVISNSQPGEEVVSAYLSFIKKFESLAIKSIKTTKYFEITTLLYRSYNIIAEAYLTKRLKNLGNNPKFIISSSAYILTGLTIEETFKPEPNYRRMLYDVTSSMKNLY